MFSKSSLILVQFLSKIMYTAVVHPILVAFVQRLWILYGVDNGLFS